MNVFVCVVLYNVSKKAQLNERMIQNICQLLVPLPYSLVIEIYLSPKYKSVFGLVKTLFKKWNFCSEKRLLQVNAFPMTAMFGMCSMFLVLAAFLQKRFMLAVEKKPIKASKCEKNMLSYLLFVFC